MNEDFWTSGIIDSNRGMIAWPGMTRVDAEKLPPAHHVGGVSTREFRTSAILGDKPFIVSVFVPNRGERGPITILLELDPEYSRKVFGVEFPGQQELRFYEDLFQKYLGSAEHTHTRAWGTIKIVEDPWTHDPSIAAFYNR